MPRKSSITQLPHNEQENYKKMLHYIETFNNSVPNLISVTAKATGYSPRHVYDVLHGPKIYSTRKNRPSPIGRSFNAKIIQYAYFRVRSVIQLQELMHMGKNYPFISSMQEADTLWQTIQENKTTIAQLTQTNEQLTKLFNENIRTLREKLTDITMPLTTEAHTAITNFLLEHPADLENNVQTDQYAYYAKILEQAGLMGYTVPEETTK